jgi:hypothetical protein
MLAHRVDGQDFGPNEGERRPQLLGPALEQFEHVGENANGEGGHHGPRAEVNEAGEQVECANPVYLGLKDIKLESQSWHKKKFFLKRHRFIKWLFV